MSELRNPYRGRLILTTEEGPVILDRMRPTPPRRPQSAEESSEEAPRFVTGEVVQAEPVEQSEIVEVAEDEETEEEGEGE